MKRVLMLLMVMALLLPAALADSMTVVNCEEWVSLRKAPDTASERLKKVPLNEVVEDCESAENGFIRCTYDGVTGYILEKYLEEANDRDNWKDRSASGYAISARRRFDSDGEHLTVTCMDPQGAVLWEGGTDHPDPTELDLTTAFMGGTADDPRVLIYNATDGLFCYAVEDGTLLWSMSDAGLGAGNRHAVDGEGRMYITGYYGPDPVCVDMDGKVLWRSEVDDPEIYWPYEITLTGEGVSVKYDMLHDTRGRVVFDYADGHVLGVYED